MGNKETGMAQFKNGNPLSFETLYLSVTGSVAFAKERILQATVGGVYQWPGSDWHAEPGIEVQYIREKPAWK